MGPNDWLSNAPVPMGPEFPMVRLTVEGMKRTLITQMGLHNRDMEQHVQKEIEVEAAVREVLQSPEVGEALRKQVAPMILSSLGADAKPKKAKR